VREGEREGGREKGQGEMLRITQSCAFPCPSISSQCVTFLYIPPFFGSFSFQPFLASHLFLFFFRSDTASPPPTFTWRRPNGWGYCQESAWFLKML